MQRPWRNHPFGLVNTTRTAQYLQLVSYTPSSTAGTYAAVAANISCLFAVVQVEHSRAKKVVNPKVTAFWTYPLRPSSPQRTKTGAMSKAMISIVKSTATIRSKRKLAYRLMPKAGFDVFASWMRLRNSSFSRLAATSTLVMELLPCLVADCVWCRASRWLSGPSCALCRRSERQDRQHAEYTLDQASGAVRRSRSSRQCSACFVDQVPKASEQQPISREARLPHVRLSRSGSSHHYRRF